MNLTILTPHKRILDSVSVEELFVPGAAGTLDIFDLHANLVTKLETGVLRWRTKEKWSTATVSTGYLEIFNKDVTIIADVSELGTEIDLNRAKRAGEIARKKIVEGGLDDTAQRKYELKLARSLARLSAVE